MKYRRLGKTDLKVSVIGIGTWQYGGEWGKDFTSGEVKEILDRGRELGFNLIDTAECYGDHLAEAFVGEAVKGSRQHWVIATKFGHEFKMHLTRDNVWDIQGILKQLEDSLRALQTDYIDLYQSHSMPDEAFNNQELWFELQKQVQAGKIRHLGASIGSNENVLQVNMASGFGAGSIQVVYNRMGRNAEKEVLPKCMEHDLGVLARVPLASGLLSGKYKPGVTFSHNDVRATWDKSKVDEALTEALKIIREEVPEGVEPAQWAMAWCLSHPAVTACIAGFKDVRQLESGAKASELTIS